MTEWQSLVRWTLLDNFLDFCHYAVPDGRIVPFCTMNSIHRAGIEKKFSVSVEEWQRKRKVEISAVA